MIALNQCLRTQTVYHRYVLFYMMRWYDASFPLSSSLIAELALTPTGESGNNHDAAESVVNCLLIGQSDCSCCLLMVPSKRIGDIFSVSAANS